MTFNTKNLLFLFKNSCVSYDRENNFKLFSGNIDSYSSEDFGPYLDTRIYFKKNDYLMSDEDNNNTLRTEDKKEEELYKIKNIFNNKKRFVLIQEIGVKKRGRQKKSIGLNDKIHINSAFDNLQTKIQVHFLSFIINISNDALITEFGQNTFYNFKDITYKIKKKVNYKLSIIYKNSSIKNILRNEISPKYKKYNKYINFDILNEVCNKSIWLEKFFNLNFLNLFVFYYNKGMPIKKIRFEGKDIIFSSRTKGFYDLLEKNENLKMKLIETAKIAYFCGYDNLIGKDSFIAQKNEIELKEVISQNNEIELKE